METESIVSELRSVPLFRNVPESALKALAQSCQWRKVPAKRSVILQGDPGNSVFVILSGKVEVTRLDDDGEESFLAERGPGEHFGEMSLLDGTPRSANVTTLTECRFLVLERATFFHIVRTTPDLAVSVILSLASRLRESDADRGARDTVRDRLVAFLRREIEAQAGDLHNGVKIRLALSRADIADRIVSSRESVSRELGQLQARGIVAVKGKTIQVLKAEKLV